VSAAGVRSEPVVLEEACRLFFTPPRARQLGAERRVVEAGRRETVTFRGHALAAWTWGGEGPTVLLVHGWCGRASQLAAFVEPLVAAGFRVFAADAPAHGESQGERSSLFEFEDLVAAQGRLEGGLHAVIGHSMGAASAAMALGHGLPAERAVLIAPIFRLRDRVTHFARRLGLDEGIEQQLVRRIEERYGSNAWQESSLDRVARNLDLPALVVHDRNDAEIPFEDGERTAKAWPGARFLATRGLGHRSLLRDRAVIDEIVRFCVA
jgi:pimeloyl-ACP methyl ester carboxylesterase